MRTKILLLPTLILFLMISFIACKKEKSPSGTDNTNEVSVQSDDQTQVSDATESIANDAAAAIEVSPTFTGRLAQNQTSTVCHATVDIDTAERSITIVYNGNDCFNGTSRTGTVVITMAHDVQWKNAGAAVTLTFQNVQITRLIDNKSVTLNGTITYTNVSGGLLITLPTQNGLSITHSISSSNMSITFEDNTQRTWQIAEQRVFTYDNGVVISTTGTHTEGTTTGIAEWGTNRLGHDFATATIEPVVIRQDCDFRVVSGQVKHVTTLVTANVTFGLDATGNPTSCPGTGGHYYFKVAWTGPLGNTLTLIFPY